MSARKHYMTIYSNRTGERIITPGEILTKELRRQRITQKELALLLGRSEKFISQLITGKVRLTYDVAYDLERTLKVPTSKWNIAEAMFQDELTRLERLAALGTEEVKDWVAGFPYDKMVEHGMVTSCDDPARRALSLFNYFGVASIEAFNACQIAEKGFPHFKQLLAEVDALR